MDTLARGGMPLLAAPPSSPSPLDEGAGTPAPGLQPESLVVIVSLCPVEQARLVASLPPDVTVLVAPTLEHAQEALQTAPADVDPGYRLLDDQRAVSFGASSVRLTPLEFSMLRVLASEPGHVFSFADLSRDVWSTGFVGDGAQVRAVVKRLRRKLVEVDAPVCIETVRSAGLRLVRRSTPID